MRRAKESPVPAQIERVRKRFAHWRKTRKKIRPIPAALWESAVQLTRQHSFHQVARALHLDYNALKKRAQSQETRSRAQKDSGPVFWEMEAGGVLPLGSECFVEMEDPRGAKLKIHVKGKGALDLLALSQCFLRSGS